MSDKAKLLPCPFCGELPVITKHFREEMYSFMHRCPVVGSISRDFRERAQDHVDIWNTRATPAEDVRAVDAEKVNNRQMGLMQFVEKHPVRAVVDEPEIVAIVESALRRSFTLGQFYWQQADSDSTCQQNKSDQTMEVQENHIRMVVESIQRLIK